MEFRKQKVVFEETGENAGTISPVCLLDEFTGNLSESVSRFMSWDNDIRITVNRYSVKEVILPNIPNWINYYIQIQYALGLAGAEALQNLSESQLMEFFELSEYDKYIFGRLWEKRKNPFCLSLFSQIVDFLERKVQGNTSYQRPLSAGQYNAIEKFRIYKHDSKRISNKIYYK